MRKSFKYRLYPNKSQTLALESVLNTCRELYNSALLERRYAYKMARVSINYHHQALELPGIKECLPDLRQVHSQVLQNVIKRADLAYKAFFRRIKAGDTPGFPRLKGKGWYDSFTFTQSGFSLSENRRGNQKLKLSKIGEVKIRLHRQIEGCIKTLTIRREGPHWYACFSCIVEAKLLPKTWRSAGIDVGLNTFAALSDGTMIENPRYLRRSEARLKVEQRSLSRKKRGSSGRRKQKTVVSKIHRKITNQRSDFLHKASARLVRDYDEIYFEDLKIKNMVKNHHLAKSISDAAWGRFIEFTSYKAESAGKIIAFVNPRDTSIECSGCGAAVKKTLSTRVHRCDCGLIIDRDINAAINILRRGTRPGGATAKPSDEA